MKRWLATITTVCTITLFGAFACGTEADTHSSASPTPPPRFVIGPDATPIVPDASGQAEIVLPEGETMLAFLPSTPRGGSYGFSLSGLQALTEPIIGPLARIVEQAVNSAAPATKSAETNVKNLYPESAVSAKFPEERTFQAPAGRGKKGFVTVNAVKVAEGERVVFYAEDANSMVLEIAQSIVDYVDRVVYPEETLMFGPVPDSDRNGKFILLASNAVNTYSNEPGQFTGGFFASKDLDGREGSNNADMLYLYLPKPVSDGGVFDHAEDYFHLMQEVIVHELQHMINYAARLSRGARLETAWLNEGLSHWAEEHFGFQRSNRIRSRHFLQSPTTTPLVGSCSTLGQRGAAFLFVKYLVKESGDPMILRKLVGTSRRGVDNVENATGRPFAAVLRDWSGTLMEEFGDKLNVAELTAEALENTVPQSAPAFFKVKGPGIFTFKAAPAGNFQGVGFQLAPPPATTATTAAM
jgi:hypothetical protein